MQFRTSIHLKIFKRFLNLHEYQSKQLMSEFGVNIQRFFLVDNPQEALEAATKLDANEMVIKAQVHAGGRGKGRFTSGLQGGVQLTKNRNKAAEIISKMIGYNLITHQTTPEGVNVQKVMIAEAKDLDKETYFAILLDRSAGGAVLVGSPKGGVDIEKVAAKTPELVFSDPVVDINAGPTIDQLENFGLQLGFSEEDGTLSQAMDQMLKLYELFRKVDATQVEINPFGITPEKEVICFDAKISFDDNAAFRQDKIFSQADISAEDPRELKAQQHNLNYIAMDGDIGCLVNGAGLAMATMDIIKMHGGSPANFLDVGGSASREQIFAALSLLNNDQNVRAIFVNIFGGIMRCDIIAQGIIDAYRASIIDKPIVIRLVGTNYDMAKEMIREAGLRMLIVEDLDEAAENAVCLASQRTEKVAHNAF